MEGVVNLRIYYNGEIIPNTHEGLQNGLSDNIQSHISKRVSNILYRNPVQFQLVSITDNASMQHMLCIYQQNRFHVPMIELYIEFEQHTGMDSVGDDVNVDEIGDIDSEEDNNDSEEEFEANYEVDDENDDGDLAGNPAVQNEANSIVSQHPFGVPSFMRTLDLKAMHALEFFEYVNIGMLSYGEGDIAVEDGEFSVGMEFGSRNSVIFTIKGYTISRGVDYTVYESEPQTFYAKCKGYGAGCDWLIRASLIRKKGCWEIRRYNGKHTCTMGTISQDHAKLDSETIADAIRPLVEANSSIKVKSIITEVQSRFNYTVSYRKAWLAKQKSVAKIFGDWKVSYQTLPVWLKSMTEQMSRSRVQIKTLLVYRENEEVQGVRVLHHVPETTVIHRLASGTARHVTGPDSAAHTLASGTDAHMPGPESHAHMPEPI
ncbi:hypothetical protein Ahy_B01g051691 [Arachis hypogaea]|uniref:Transposase MuDR plant domain-containing protein n=1 Tax=Arachis hypogaea TaxID=3818 RepID=A0A445AMK9_ARAHY|nr:hypothetical protein Ahy_B01g051691 [Arachis hypogaea]